MSELSNLDKSFSKLSVCERRDKSSFDRFGDDLTELILSFLTIEDKFRFECLNARIESLIFNKQNQLIITSRRDISLENEFKVLSQKILLTINLYKYKIDYRLLRVVLRKFKYLNVIKICGFVVVEDELLRVIAQNCPHLRELWFRNLIQRTIDLSADSVVYLGKKCGRNLQSLRFQTSNENIRQLLKFTPNLVSLKVLNIESILFEDKKVLPKLKDISFKNGEQNQNLIIRFQNQYSDVIQKLSFKLVAIDSKLLSGFGTFLRLQSLDLVITDANSSDFKAIDQGLRQIAHNCVQINELSIRININCEDNYNFLQTIGTFAALTTLEVNLSKTSVNLTPEEHDTDYGTIEDLQQLSRLKRLTLHLSYLSDSCFENIEQYFPNLETIFVETCNTITDQTLQYLSRLNNLQSIALLFSYWSDLNGPKVTDSGILYVVNNCLHLQCLILSNKSNDTLLTTGITARSINAFKAKAIENPKINYYFEFTSDENKLRVIQLSRSMKAMPNNLSVKIDWVLPDYISMANKNKKKNNKCIIA